MNDIDMWNDIEYLEKLIKKYPENKDLKIELKKLIKEFNKLYINN